MKITFIGNKQDGYTAYFSAFEQVDTRRTDIGWTGSYAGNPERHNPVEIDRDGWRSKSAMCPRIIVGTGFKTRREAADAAYEAMVTEQREIAAERRSDGNP